MEWLEASRLTLKAILLPPASLFILLLLGLLAYRRGLGKLATWGALLGLYLMSIPATTGWLAPRVEQIPAATLQQLAEQHAAAILVLCAGQQTFNPELADQARVDALSLQRLSYAVRLQHATGLPLILSGGAMKEHEAPLAEVGARWLQAETGIQPLALETRSRSTWENLAFSAPLLKKHGIERVLLVTHAFHMPRALQAARAAGVDAIAAPFGFIGKQVPAYARPPLWEEWLPHASSMQRNYLLIHELIGHFWYAFKS